MEQLLRIATWTAAIALAAGLGMTLAGLDGARYVLHGGLCLLIATPIARVFLALAGYLCERDWVFFGVTIVVLLSLIFPIAKYLVSLPG